jgi:hypothetical protein
MLSGATPVDKAECLLNRKLDVDNIGLFVCTMITAPAVFEIEWQWQYTVSYVLSSLCHTYPTHPLIAVLTSPLTFSYYTKEDFLDVEFCQSIMLHLHTTFRSVQDLLTKEIGRGL